MIELIGFNQVSALKIGTIQVGALKIGTLQVSALEIGIPQVDTLMAGIQPASGPPRLGSGPPRGKLDVRPGKSSLKCIPAEIYTS